MFLQGLALDSAAGVAWGALAGVVALLALVLFVNRVGYRLPMKTLFNASTVLLVVTAVMLLGKGLHALQEVGVLPLAPIPFFTVDLLGIYPDAVSLVPQLVLRAGAAGLVLIKRSRTARLAAASSRRAAAAGRPSSKRRARTPVCGVQSLRGAARHGLRRRVAPTLVIPLSCMD